MRSGPAQSALGVVLLGLALVAASTLYAPAFVPGDGKGKPDLDCLIGLDGVEPGDLTPSKGGRRSVQCTDCDPTCDRDGEASPNQACTFKVAVCLNQPEVPGCQPQELKKAKARPKKLGLRAPTPTGAEPGCGAFTDLVVSTRKKGRKPGKRTVKLVAKPHGKGIDKDTILFVCTPRPMGEACPAPTTTTTIINTIPTLPCPSRAVTFRVASSLGGAADSGVWPGGVDQRELEPGCEVTIARPTGAIDAGGDAFEVVGFAGYSSCFGAGGEDGDGCGVASCPPGSIGSCEGGRPTCSAALNGSGEATFRVRCNGPGVFPVSFVDNLLVKERMGQWTRGEGLVASLGALTGEVDVASVLLHPELLNREATGILAMAYEYLDVGLDAEAKGQITRLLGKIVFTSAQLEAMAGTAPSGVKSGSLRLSAPEDCAAFYEGYEVPPGVGKCLQESSITVGNKQYRLFAPDPSLPSAGWSAQHYGWARETIMHTVPTYDAFGPAPPVRTPPTDLVFSVHDHGEFSAQAASELDPCVVTLYASMRNESELDFKQILAHELGHCFQQETFPEQNKVAYEYVKWREEGLAEYLSNWAYPGNNLEWGAAPQRSSALLDLQSRELATTVLERDYANFLFFQYLANRIGNGGIITLVQSFPNSGGASEQADTLAAYGGMATIYHDFAKALTDKTVVDTGGGVIPYEMTPANRPMVAITGPDRIKQDFDAFSVSRYHLAVDNDHQAEVTFTEQGDVREASRPIQGEEWGEVPVVLPDRCSEVVLVATSTQRGSWYELDVPEVREATAQCVLEGEWLVDNASLNVMQTAFETDYVSGEIRGTFRADGMVEVVYDQFEFRVSDTDILSVGGIDVEQYEEFTYTTNAQGVTTYKVDGDSIEFGDFFESSYLQGTETVHHIRRNDPPNTIGPDIDETTVRDARGRDVFASIPRYELGSTLRLVGPTREVVLHRVGESAP